MTFVADDDDIMCFAPCDDEKVNNGLCSCHNRATWKSPKMVNEYIGRYKHKGLRYSLHSDGIYRSNDCEKEYTKAEMERMVHSEFQFVEYVEPIYTSWELEEIKSQDK